MQGAGKSQDEKIAPKDISSPFGLLCSLHRAAYAQVIVLLALQKKLCDVFLVQKGVWGVLEKFM